MIRRHIFLTVKATSTNKLMAFLGLGKEAMESLLGCARCWLLVLLCWHIAALLLPHNMSNPNIQRLCCGQCHVVGQQRWLLHESAVLISMGMCIPRAEKTQETQIP